jgi:acyl-coenzyme A thioesterase 9
MIFGGFLLKSTFELAFTCASASSHTRPKFIALDPSTFENPVPVGSVLYLTATLAYTDSPILSSSSPSSSSNLETVKESEKEKKKTRIQVRVDSKIRNIEHAETKPTGQFNYTFEVERDIKVIPETYSQFMICLDARRRARMGVLNGQDEGSRDGTGGAGASGGAGERLGGGAGDTGTKDGDGGSGGGVLE